MFRLDATLIRHALQTASDRGFASVEIALGDDTFEAKLLPRKPMTVKVVESLGEPSEAWDIARVNATAVGYFREGSVPLEVGQKVEVGQVVAEIISLGLANEVLSKWSGTITEVLVEKEQPVEYGQALAKIRVENV